MAKGKKAGLSEIKANKHTTKKSINPFNVHINRQKFNVLNRQLKTDRGLPGVAKAKALKKRKETLLQEYKIINKSNKFFDRRIGENNSAMTKEDRIIARFSAERMKSHRRKDIFNLADDEVLTHKGQSIAEIEKFDEPVSDEDEKGLDAKFVEGANFGGGIVKESKSDRASIIEQLIAESKKRKAERQLAKEKTVQKTEELDAEWKELIPIVNMGNRDDDNEIVEKKDPYDVILGNLKFEPCGAPSNKLKTEAEIAEEEAHKLKELEEERLRRMRGEELIDIQNKQQHRSADDLDDGFEIEEDDFELTYDKDGKAVGLDMLEKFEVLNVKNETNSDESESDSVGDEESGMEKEEESDSAEKDTAEKEDENTVEKEDEDTAEPSNADDSDSDSTDSFSDLKNTIDEENHYDSDDGDRYPGLANEKMEVGKHIERKESDNFASSTEDIDNEQKLKGKKKVSFGENVVLNSVSTCSLPKKTLEELEKEKEERQIQMEKARNELPYAFEAPTTYEELQEVMKERTLNEQAVIIERIIKCNHPSLSQKNTEKMENLFALLMQYLNDTDVLEVWSLLDRLAPYLFDLAHFSPQNAGFCVKEVLLEKHNDYLKKKTKYPSVETFVFLKLIPQLFPASDKKHPVTTPAFIFISEMLHQCHVATRRSISAGLFLVSLVTEYVWLSKRFLPEVLNFLRGVIHLATPSTALPVIPPFKKEHKFLFLHQSCSDQNDLDLSMQGSDLSPKPGCKIDDAFRIKSIYCALKLTEMYARLYEELPASKLLFEPIRKHLEALEIKKYPEIVQKAYEQLIGVLTDLMKKKLEGLVMPARKPKALRLYEPMIQPVYDSKTRNLPHEKAEHVKLVRRYRQEMKGALREIRRDRQFISKVRLKEQWTSDQARKRKVKEIYAWGAEQQSEFNKLKRKKKK